MYSDPGSRFKADKFIVCLLLPCIWPHLDPYEYFEIHIQARQNKDRYPSNDLQLYRRSGAMSYRSNCEHKYQS